MDRPAGLRAAKVMDADGEHALVVFSVEPVIGSTAVIWGAGKKSVVLKLSNGAVTAALNSWNNAGSEYPVNSRLNGVIRHMSAGTIVWFPG